MMMVQRIRIMVVLVTFVLLTNLAIANPRKMSGWDFPRRQTETGKTPILLTTTRYSQVIIFKKRSCSSPLFFYFSIERCVTLLLFFTNNDDHDVSLLLLVFPRTMRSRSRGTTNEISKKRILCRQQRTGLCLRERAQKVRDTVSQSASQQLWIRESTQQAMT